MEQIKRITGDSVHLISVNGDEPRTLRSIGNGGGGGTKDYNALQNLPSINGTTVQGNKTLSDYGLMTEMSSALNGKVDKVSGKGLSSNDFTNADKSKLNGIEAGAEVNVNADWNAVDGDALILNKPTIPTVPTDVSAFNNDSGYVDAAGAAAAAPVQSVNGATGDVVLSIPATAADVGALPNSTTYAASGSVGGAATVSHGIPFAMVDGTSTSTAYTATISGITAYYDGLTIMLYNGKVTSAANFTIDINGLGALGSYSNMSLGNPVTPTSPTRDSTIWNLNYAMLFTYYSNIGGTGISGWVMYRGYDANTNTIGYQVRTNSMSLPMTSVTYRYRLLFESADHAHFVPATNSTSTNATSARTVCQDPINPFGDIRYYGTTASVAAGSRPSAAYLWQEYAFNLGYSFQKSPNYSLTSWAPVYLVCAPQSDGSAIIDSTTPITQTLPTTEDGKIYIYLGVAYSTTAIELTLHHPVYYYKSGAIRPWTFAV